MYLVMSGSFLIIGFVFCYRRSTIHHEIATFARPVIIGVNVCPSHYGCRLLSKYQILSFAPQLVVYNLTREYCINVRHKYFISRRK